MKFSVHRTAFIQYLNDVQRAISSKAALEILSGIKLDLSEDGLTLTGSNSDISIETIISIADEKAALNIEKTGRVVLPARFFNEIVKKLPEDTMSIEVNDRFQATIKSGSAEFTINGLDPDDYPHLPEIDSREQLTLPGDILKQVINQTVIAASKQETRPILTGIHLAIKGDQLLAVATDSHRLSQRKLNLATASEVDYDIIVPAQSMNELAKMIGELSEDIEIQISENQILFILGNTSFYSRLLEGNYPDTERLIPQSSSTSLEVNAPEFLRAIERASLLSHEGRNNVVKLALQAGSNQATLYSNSPEVGNVEEELTFNKLEGNDLEISFNPDYMKDALRSFGQSEVVLDFTLPLRPFTLVPSESQGEFIQLITPVRTI
ncbi:DNA polymerase III subunit beta [Ligilactobacillus apodemi]|uniref:Beta sliding clamp n=1 Tax=Ligilactobacillus apodemi DSM 16634 = JCM 16172 TaxID=1423724 RepID=A0A0R1U833_9LACO|nr:DNA polymerase III subunit beta [Ligilactobacillus apodemi]KRL87427.1 DNA polymerase III, beta chain [Ligilactobacillus apodemi DSM 16634 = JCM 16172]MBD5068583.1 DNA polymerase III subunit beta [Lactobacillus sp.]